MKLYYPKTHYDKSKRSAVFPLLKPFIKNKGFSDEARMAMYHVSEKDFQISDDLETADVAILTMSYNYYVNKNLEKTASDFIDRCRKVGKKVLIWNSGDFGVKIPDFKNGIIFRESGYRSKFLPNEFTLPSFISDPLKLHYNTDFPITIPFSEKPIIGFCGQANSSLWKALKELILISKRNLWFNLSFSKNEPQKLLSSAYLRARILKSFEDSESCETNFIKRKKYRAGVTSKKESHPTTIEFYDNLKNSGYGICVRGGGNFSVRFYEVLAMGRIPVLLDTDSSLPLQNSISWKRHIVFVNAENKHRIAEKVCEFHQGMNEVEFIQLQQINRNLWKEKLTLGGFFKTFFKEEFKK